MISCQARVDEMHAERFGRARRGCDIKSAATSGMSRRRRALQPSKDHIAPHPDLPFTAVGERAG